MAEYSINNIDELPDHYTTQKFWQDFKIKILYQRNRTDVGYNYSDIKTSIDKFKNSNKILLQELSEKRTMLCDAFDIPADFTPLYNKQSGSAGYDE